MKLMDESKSICIDVTVPGPLGRAKGLLGTKVPPPPARGVLLNGSQIHTIGMRYAIDVVHLDRAGKVITIKTIQPYRLGRRERGTRRVLELAGGEATRVGLREGMTLFLHEGDCR